MFLGGQVLWSDRKRTGSTVEFQLDAESAESKELYVSSWITSVVSEK